jgi:hypothetical protein
MKITLSFLIVLYVTTLLGGQAIKLPPTPQFPQPQRITLGGTPAANSSNQGQTLHKAPNGSPTGTNGLTAHEVMLQANPHMQSQRAQTRVAQMERERLTSEIKYDFPDHRGSVGAEKYMQGFTEIKEMLEGERLLDLKRTIFLTENAYSTQAMNYEWFAADVSGNADIIKSLIRQKGYKEDSPTAKKWGIQQFLTDTVRLKDKDGKVIFVHKPYKYDFDDPYGTEDWSKQFVTKLMKDGKGQCHSLPLYYLILAEELGVEAWLSFSPSHSYIKVRDGKGNMLNYETTNGYYTTNAYIQSSGFVKAEALRSGVYMDTVPKKEVIAICLADLATGYAVKFGYDQFVLDCIEKSLAYSPNNIGALTLKADYQTQLVRFIVNQLGFPPVSELPNYPLAYNQYIKMHEIYRQIDQLGYESMPEEAYKEWLKSFESQKEKHPTEIMRP